MNGRPRTIAAISAIALLLGGGAIAAVTATGRSTHHTRRAASPRHARAGGRDLATASAYLGVPIAQLRVELDSGKTLAQIAQALPGHSVAGLEAALVAARRARLAQALADLPQHVRAEVERAGGPGGVPSARAGHVRAGAGGLFAAPASIGTELAAYLGISPQVLRGELEAGHTLADIARANKRSQAGLGAVIVQAKKQALASAVAAGAIGEAREKRVLATLARRVQLLVGRNFAHAETH